jgi:hypothetical protein
LLSLQAKVAVEQVKVKAHEIDKQLGISEKALALEKTINEKVKQLDDSWKISEKANLAANTFKNTVVGVSQTAATKVIKVSNKISENIYRLNKSQLLIPLWPKELKLSRLLLQASRIQCKIPIKM